MSLAWINASISGFPSLPPMPSQRRVKNASRILSTNMPISNPTSLTSDDSVAQAVAKIPDVDVVINNAGVGFGGPLEAFSSDQFAAQMDVNVVGAFRVAKAVLPGMRAKKSGLIIQVSSVAGRAAFPGFGLLVHLQARQGALARAGQEYPGGDAARA